VLIQLAEQSNVSLRSFECAFTSGITYG
jgi:hypothetical protein